MPKRFFASEDTLYIYDGDTLKEIPEIVPVGFDEREEIIKPVVRSASPKIKKAKKGQKVCKRCGVPGHMAKTCPSGKTLPRESTASGSILQPVKKTTAGLKHELDWLPPGVSEEDLAKDIKDRWVSADGSESASSLSFLFGITIAQFDTIVERNNIRK